MAPGSADSRYGRRKQLAAAIAASAVSVFSEPFFHFALTKDDNAQKVLYHLNSGIDLALAVAMFLGLVSSARVFGSRPLMRASVISLLVTAANIAGNEIILLTGVLDAWQAIPFYGILYILSALLFSAAFFRLSRTVGWISEALGGLWLLSGITNAASTAGVVTGSEDLFWSGLRGSVGLSIVIHALLCAFFAIALKSNVTSER